MSIAEQGAQTISNIPEEIADDDEYTAVMKGIEMAGIDFSGRQHDALDDAIGFFIEI